MEFYQRPSDGEWAPVPCPVPLRRVIRAALLNALAYTGGDQDRAARCLEMHPRTFGSQLRTYDIPSARTGRPTRAVQKTTRRRAA